MGHIGMRERALKIAALLPPSREDANIVLSLVEDILDWAYPPDYRGGKDASASDNSLANDIGSPETTPK
jgi:hypothetical protein